MACESIAAALFAPAAVELERRDDGTLIARCPMRLGACATRAGDWLEARADTAPDRPFLLERGPGGAWNGVDYAQARRRVRRLAAGLLQRKLSAVRPVAILSDNGIDHALLALAAMHVGVPVAPLSPAYSLMSKDFAKLRAIVRLLEPGMIFAADSVRYGGALEALRGGHAAEIVTSGESSATDASSIAAIEDDSAGGDVAVSAAFAAVGPDTIAKFLFTSGSTGNPKAVINTQRMLTANQQAKAQLWPFMATEPPVILDWLPWSHTFGGNHNFNIVLANGGTLYIDAGKPLPGLFDRTIANLREIAPTIYFNVPRGYDMLIAALRADDALRAKFFSRLRVIFYAGAALPQNLWEALAELSLRELGRQVPLVTSWGSTETAPLATDCHFQAPRSGVIGNPVPGTELKLIPQRDAAAKLEIRVRGPNVTPGYWREPALTAAAFDDEGYYVIGDAVRFFDAERPEAGLVFDGRLAEDFKLATGTSVNVGSLRIRGVAALAPLAQDIVVTGHDGDACGFLIFPNPGVCREAAGLPADAAIGDAIAHRAVRERIRRGLQALRDEGGGSSTFATRAIITAEPPSIDAGEITDKGYLNQRAVRERRAALVEALHATPPGDDVIVA